MICSIEIVRCAYIYDDRRDLQKDWEQINEAWPIAEAKKMKRQREYKYKKT